MLNRKLSIVALVLCFVLIIGMVAYTEAELFKVDLTLFERFVVRGLLPQKASFATWKIINELQLQLAPSEEEYKAAGLKPDPFTGGTAAELGWDKVKPKEIVFGEVAKGLVVSALEKLDKDENLTVQHLSLYVKFIIGEEEEIKEGE